MADTAAPRPRAVHAHRLYGMLLPIPIVCFVGALLTDYAYQDSGGNLLWLNFSSWLITAGLVFGAVAGLLLIIELFRGAKLVAHALSFLAAWVVQLVNAFVHTRDGWTAVVPLGLTLSLVAAASILLSGWLWQSVRYRAGGFT